MSHVRKEGGQRRIVKHGPIIILMGKPCAGKSVAAGALNREAGFVHSMSSEEIPRAAKSDEKLSAELKRIKDSGKRWDDKLVNRVMLKYLSDNPDRPHSLDGYPRSKAQAEALFGYALCVRADLIVMEIDVSDALAEVRRGIREKERKGKRLPLREDDDPLKHSARVEDYNGYAPDIRIFFRANSVRFHRIDGSGTIEDVCSSVLCAASDVLQRRLVTQ